MRHLITLAAATATLAVASCSNPATETADAAETAAPAADVGAVLTVADLPKLRPGVWRNTVTDGDGEVEVIRQCVGPNEPFELTGSSDCVPTLHRTATGISVSGQCAKDGLTTEINGTITGDYQARGSMDIRLKVARNGEPLADMRMRNDSVYEGPCPAGQEPGLIQDGE